MTKSFSETQDEAGSYFVERSSGEKVQIFLNHNSQYASKDPAIVKRPGLIDGTPGGEAWSCFCWCLFTKLRCSVIRLRAAYWSYMNYNPSGMPDDMFYQTALPLAMQMLDRFIMSTPSIPPGKVASDFWIFPAALFSPFDTSNTPFSLKESQDLYSYLECHENDLTHGNHLLLRKQLICWILWNAGAYYHIISEPTPYFTNTALHDYHSGSGPKYKPNRLFDVLTSLLCFGVPRHHYVVIIRAQRNVWCRGGRDWDNHIAGLTGEWNTLNLAVSCQTVYK